MTDKILRKREPSTTRTRTNKDIIMIIVGVTLILLFAIIIYFSVVSSERPVTSPHSSLQNFPPRFGISDSGLAEIREKPCYTFSWPHLYKQLS